jgi:ArsR family transcriptional regulator
MTKDLAVFKAFSDETRLRILFLLAERELCVCEIVAVLGMQQGKISRHLAVLKHAELVSDRRDGTWIYYSLSEPDTGLKRRLHDYLKAEREHVPSVAEDLGRLDGLACEGTICVPHPAPVTIALRE